mmetsp:Transcript_37561/g.57540  ORF Transcript_37561/g.57540 Transcript_37561/m.57540 type:complete len:106 (+) Transcript_37561:4582-4899(+)
MAREHPTRRRLLLFYLLRLPAHSDGGALLNSQGRPPNNLVDLFFFAFFTGFRQWCERFFLALASRRSWKELASTSKPRCRSYVPSTKVKFLLLLPRLLFKGGLSR